MSKQKPITTPELQEAAKQGNDSLLEFIKGDGTASRPERVARANEALRLLRKEMQNDPVEQRKLVVGTTRVVLQDAVDEIRTQITDSAEGSRAELEAELKTVDQKKDAAIEDERKLASVPELAQIEGREIYHDIREGDWKTWVAYGGAALGAGIAARYVWDHTFGAMFKWFRGGKGEPGFVERWSKRLAVAGAAVAGLFGAGTFMHGSGKGVLDEAGNAVKGAKDELVKTGKEIGDLAMRDVQFVEKLRGAKDSFEMLGIATTEGVPLMFEHGQVLVEIGNDAVVLPGLTIQKTLEWIEKGEQPEDYWLVWGAAAGALAKAAAVSATYGTIYLVTTKTMNAVMTGHLNLPRTRAGAALTAMKVVAGPLGTAADVARLGWNATTARGRNALRMRYVSRSLPAQILSNISWSMTRLNTQARIQWALADWSQLRVDTETARTLANQKKIFTDADAAGLESTLNQRMKDIRKALVSTKLDANAPTTLWDLKAAARNASDDAFKQKVDTYLIAQERAALRAQEAAANAQPRVPLHPMRTPTVVSENVPAANTSASDEVAEQEAPLRAEIADTETPIRAELAHPEREPELTLEPAVDRAPATLPVEAPVPVEKSPQNVHRPKDGGATEGTSAPKPPKSPRDDRRQAAEKLLNLDQRNSPFLDTRSMPAPNVDATSIQDTKRTIDTSRRRGDTDTDPRTNIKGRR